MAHAYTPGLKVLQHAKVEKNRRLPIKGEITKQVGDLLKPEDVVFLSLSEEKDFISWFNSGKNPSSEWRFHQDIYKHKRKLKLLYLNEHIL